MTRRQILSGITVGILLSSCRGMAPLNGGTTPSVVPFATPSAPQAGMATVYGRIIKADSGEPYVNIPVRLATVLHTGTPSSDSFLLDDAQSPGAMSDTQGYFTLANVDPKDYVIIIGDINVQFAVPTSTPDNARVWSLQADQVLNIGELLTVLP